MIFARWRDLLGLRRKARPIRRGDARDRASRRSRAVSIEALEPRCLLTGGAIQLGLQTGLNDQPYVDIELSADGVGLGPYDAGGYGFGLYPYNHMLLDTGSNSVLAVSNAAAELVTNGLISEGIYQELGVGGYTEFDLSNPCQLDFWGTDPETVFSLPQTADGQRIMFSPLVDLAGMSAEEGGIPGIVGMPAMIDRVTTLDMSQWATITDLFDLLTTPLGVSFHDTLPAGNGHRYSVAVDTRIVFDPADGVVEGDGLPVWAPIPFLTATPEYNGVRQSGGFLLDTGAQMTVISTQLAFSLGLDENGDGVFNELDPAFFDTIPIGGVGGTVEVPEMLIHKFRIPTEQGPDLVWMDTTSTDPSILVVVADIAPGIDGVLGVDMLTSGLDFMFDDVTWEFVITGAAYFDQIHFDFRNLDNGSGTVYFDLHPSYDQITPEGDMVPPTVTGYAMANDTGLSPSDQISSDNTPQLTFTFSEAVNHTTGAVTVTDSSGGSITPSSTTWGTSTLTLGFDTALPDDVYTVTLTGSAITDDAGNPLAGNQPNGDEVRHFTIDTTAPAAPSAPNLQAASDTGLLNNDNITADNTPTFDLTGASPYFRFYRGGTKLSGDYETANPYTLTAQADATYNYQVTAVDAAGNESALSPGLSVTIDTVAPAAPSPPDLQAASDSGVSSIDNVTADNTPTFDLTGASPYFRFYRGGTKISGDYETANPYTLGTQADATYNYQVSAVDLAGNESAKSTGLSVTIDTVAPAAPSAPDLQGASDSGVSSIDNVTADTTPTFDLTGASPYFRFYRGGAKISGDYESGTAYTTAAQLDGAYGYQVTAVDAAGNESLLSTGLTVEIDTAAPAVPGAPDLQAASDTGLSDADNVTNLTTLTFDVAASPYFRLYRDGVPIGPPYPPGPGSYTTGPEPAGTHSYQVSAVDAAGNESALSGGLSVTIDLQPPTGTSYSLVDDTGTSSTDQITSDTTPVLTFVFSEVVHGGDADYSIQKGLRTIAPEIVSGWGTNTLTLTLPMLDEEGEYTVTLKGSSTITDTAGNPLGGGTDWVEHFTIDTAVPTADVVDVTPDPRTSAVESINVVFSEAVYGLDWTDLTLSRNGVVVPLSASQDPTTTDNITWTLGNLTTLTGLLGGAPTNYVLTLTAAGSGITDTAGNALAANASDAWILNPATFNGTANADTFEFIAAGGVGGLPTMHQLKVTLFGSPMVTYYYDAAGPVSLSIDAKAGSDKLTITGGPGKDTTVINRYYVQHTGPGATTAPGYYFVYGNNVETIVDNAGAGTGQRSTFYDSPDNGDVFTAYCQFRTGSMRSAAGNPNAYNDSSTGYDEIMGGAANGGTGDTANLYDSNGNDYFVAKAGALANPQSYIMRVSGGTGPVAFVNAGVGFETVNGIASAGGVDEALLFGSTGDDTMNFQPGYPSGSRAYITRPGGYFVYAQNFKKITGYPDAGNDLAVFYDTAGNDVFTASPTRAELVGPAGSNIWNIAATDLVNPTYKWETVRVLLYTPGAHGYDKAYLTGSTGNDTFLAYANPRTVNAGIARLSGTGYFIEVNKFNEVRANVLTGNDTARLFDGPGNDYFWGHLGVAALTDGSVDDATGDLVMPNSYYYRVYGFDSNVLDHVNVDGLQGGTNRKRVIEPLDYVLSITGFW